MTINSAIVADTPYPIPYPICDSNTMKPLLKLFIALVVLVSSPSQPLFADEDPPRTFKELTEAIVLIYAGDLCGTGFFISPTQILTNAHVIEEGCSRVNESCENLSLQYSARFGSIALHEKRFSTLTLSKRQRAIDFAILELDEEAASVRWIPLEENSASVSESVLALGFPACHELRKDTGKVLSENSLYYTTSVVGKKGNSGSALINENGNLVGLVVESNGFTEGLLGSLFGTDIELTAIKASTITKALSETKSRASILEGLSQFYGERVSKTSGLSRSIAALEFTQQSELFFSELVSQDLAKDAAHILAWYGNANLSILDFPVPEATSLEVKLLTSLAWAGYFETYGIHHPASFKELSAGSIHQKILEITNNPKQQEALKQIAAPFLEKRESSLTVAVLFGIALITGVVIIYAFLIGLTIGKVHGSLLKRVAFILGVTLMYWPLTLGLLYALLALA